jgi:hypothetical protein
VAPACVNSLNAVPIRLIYERWVSNSFLTKFILKWLRKRAYSQEQFRQMASRTSFKTCAIREEQIGLEVALTK